MKKFVSFLAFIMVALGVRASYLNWQVNSDPGGSGRLTSLWHNDWDTAYLVEVDSAGKTQRVETQLVDRDGSHVGSYSETGISLDVVREGYSYYIELVNSKTGDIRGFGETRTYAQLSSGNHISGTLEDVPAVDVWHGGAFNVPEPTSAMLMLLGVAGLALRRKQRIAA